MLKITNLSSCRLYGILDDGYLEGRDPAEITKQMIEGGVDIVQVRAKNRSEADGLRMVKMVVRVTRPAGIPLIVNDHPLVAAEAEADGVHVGQEDLSVAEARRLAGDGMWVGKSTHSIEQALAAEKEGADYIGVGPVFATPTKPDYEPVGLDLVRLVARSDLRIPFFCIGGIKLENATQVLKSGASRVVVVSGILQAPDIARYCRELKAKLRENASQNVRD